MRTMTARGLAAGAGAAAVLLAGAVTASAVPGEPTAAFWEDFFTGNGESDVACTVSVTEGLGVGQTVSLTEDDWAPELRAGGEWIGVVLKIGDDYDPHAWAGYGNYTYGLDASDDSSGISHVIVCQAGTGETADPAEATDAGESDDAGGTPEIGGSSDPTGPAVETDGPASSGPGAGLLGGAALALAGAGAAGWAMRRRPESR